MQKLIDAYKKWRKEVLTDNFVSFVLSWDTQTTAGSDAIQERVAYMPRVDERNYERMTDKSAVEIIYELYEHLDEIDDPVLRFEIKKIKKNVDELTKLPLDLIRRQSEIFALSTSIWSEARSKNDFSIFAPTLEKIVALTKEKLSYLETPKLKDYDYLLNNFSNGVTQNDYDLFFKNLSDELLDFSNEVASKKQVGDFAFTEKSYAIERQRRYVEYLADVMQYNRNRGCIGESEHPFTSGFSNKDVRVTIHYYPELLISSIYSAIHEMGHALFEQQTDDALNETFCSGCDDMALHESQSRFYENIIGRSKEFWCAHLGKLKKLYPRQLQNVTPDIMYMHVNNVQNDYIRTEADELTYFKHIMLRYEIEKEILNGLPVKEINGRWNERFKQLFGMEIKDEALGCLQDVHWSYGEFGYFPSYALGSAYSSQIFDKMNEDFDVYASLADGTTQRINEWLKNKIHKYGSSRPAKEIFEEAVGGAFDASHYINYLKNKYSKLYNIK